MNGNSRKNFIKGSTMLCGSNEKSVYGAYRCPSSTHRWNATRFKLETIGFVRCGAKVHIHCRCRLPVDHCGFDVRSIEMSMSQNMLITNLGVSFDAELIKQTDRQCPRKIQYLLRISGSLSVVHKPNGTFKCSDLRLMLERTHSMLLRRQRSDIRM